MKKALGIVLAAVMTAAVLTACGGGSKGNGIKQQAAVQTQEAAQTQADGKETEAPAEETKEAPAAENEASQAQDVNNDAYVIMVVDTENAPVVGARVQFCSDTTCFMGKTDDTGVAVFSEPEGKYTVHVLKAPEGYKQTEEEFAVPETYGIVRIVLEKE